MQHLSWIKHGRRFSHADEGAPNKFTITSRVGEHNVDVHGDGSEFAPYVWNAASRILRIADNELHFTPEGVELWHDGKKASSLSLFQESAAASVWAKSVETQERKYTIIDGSETISISCALESADQKSSIVFTAGRGHKVDVSFGIEAKASKNLRLSIEFDKDATRARGCKIGEHDECDLPCLTFSDGTWLAWKTEEEADHKVVNAKKLALAEKAYAAGEKKSIHPDTWGTDVGIAATGDDGTTIGADGWYTNYLTGEIYFGRAPGYTVDYLDAGFRWTGITIPEDSTIDTCYIDAYCFNGTYGNVGSPNCTVSAWDTDSPAQYSGGNVPRSVTKTTANVSWSPSIATIPQWKTSPNLAAIVQEILDSYGLSSSSINFALVGPTGSGDHYICFEDYSAAGSNEAELTITYTPPIPPTTLAPTTLAPTTVSPTTLAPTTPTPTTIVSTTLAPTTISTTLAPTTLPPPPPGKLVGGKLVNDSLLFGRLIQ